MLKKSVWKNYLILYLVEYEQTQVRRVQDFPNSENQILDLTDMLEAVRALFQTYEPETFKAWEKIVDSIFDESGYSRKLPNGCPVRSRITDA